MASMSYQTAQSSYEPGEDESFPFSDADVYRDPNGGIQDHSSLCLPLSEEEIFHRMASVPAKIYHTDCQLNRHWILTSNNLYGTAANPLRQFHADMVCGASSPSTFPSNALNGFAAQHAPNHLTAMQFPERRLNYPYRGEEYSPFPRDDDSRTVPPSHEQNHPIFDFQNHSGNSGLSIFESGPRRNYHDENYNRFAPAPLANYSSNLPQMCIISPSMTSDFSHHGAWVFGSLDDSQSFIQPESGHDSRDIGSLSHSLQRMVIRTPVSSADPSAVNGGLVACPFSPSILPLLSATPGVPCRPNSRNLANYKDKFGYGVPSVVFQRLTEDGAPLSTHDLDRLLYPVGQESVPHGNNGRKCRAKARLTREGEWEHLNQPCDKELSNIDCYRRHVFYCHLGCTRRDNQKQLDMLKQRLEEVRESMK